jgi:RimJ/RimL family protein N-acetyltransferase
MGDDHRQKERGVSDGRQTGVDIRPWSDEDLPLLERLMGDPAMTAHIGGPETPEKIRERHGRYLHPAHSGEGGMFVIVVGPRRVAAGSVGYWAREWQGRHVWETGWSMLPEFQGRGAATKATVAVVQRARAEGTHRFLHAYPSVDNAASNAICRKLGFTFQEEVDFEYPKGALMRCNDWRLDLFARSLEAPST